MLFSQTILWRCSRLLSKDRFLSSKASSPFVESNKLVKSRNVKVPPKYPSFGSKKPAQNMTQNFKYLLVLDFEATCQENSKGPMLPVQEIIEFPVVQLSTTDWKEVRRFHKYVQPTESPRLSTFCTSLTGIIQEMVDDKQPLSEVLAEFDVWLKEDSRLQPDNFAFVTCGDWDLKVALPNEANYKKLNVPKYFNQWINVKKAYAEHTNEFARGMTQLLKNYNLQLQGRHHSGIDDVANICRIVRCLGTSGHNYRITSSTQPSNTTRMFRDVPIKR